MEKPKGWTPAEPVNVPTEKVKYDDNGKALETKATPAPVATPCTNCKARI